MGSNGAKRINLPEISFENYALGNGMNVILHPDHSIPIVAVNLWYHVGSKNEKPGRTGFAHLFEHLMFKGSLHHPGEFFAPLEKIGASANGSTSEDRTIYYENLPSNYLELALWLESDRMGFLLPVLTQEQFDIEREIVKNERREWVDNQPYGKAEELLLSLLYPAHHPYSWPVIGTMADLDAASLADIVDFFNTYYKPNNVSLCIAGDFDIQIARDWVEQYFGAIAPGPPLDRITAWKPTIASEKRMIAEDQVHLPRLYYAWHTPAWFEPGDAELDLFAEILTAGKTSRLYKSLVYEQQIAQDVNAQQTSLELGGHFTITVTAREGHTLEALERALDKELRHIFSNGINADELKQSQNTWLTRFIRRLSRIENRADLLNEYSVIRKDPDQFEWDVQRYLNTNIENLNDLIKKHLDFSNRAVLHLVPFKQGSVGSRQPDRTCLPEALSEPVFIPPKIKQDRLSNGLEIWLVEDHRMPLVHMNLVLQSGWADDPVDRPGTAALTAELLDEGTTTRDAIRISEDIRRLGASLGTKSFFDGSFVMMNLLKENWQAGVELLADLVLHPTLPEPELERQRQIYLGRIQQEAMQPFTLAFKIFLRKLYGAQHPYGQPYTGSGTESSIRAIQRLDLLNFYQVNYIPNNSKIILVGDITLDRAKMELEKAIGWWESGRLGHKTIADPTGVPTTQILIIDKPGAPQSAIVAGGPGIRRNDPDFIAFEVMNNALGGQYTSRINMNLREDKGYTYGAGTFTLDTRGIGPFICYASVYTETTAESIFEMIAELKAVIGERPLTDTEIADSKNNLIKGFPQGFQTYSDIAGQMDDMILFDLPEDEWQGYMDRVNSVDGETATRVAQRILDPDRLLIVVVGDREKISSKILEFGLGQVFYVAPENLL